jgi:lysophospholipase L1-like esterase
VRAQSAGALLLLLIVALVAVGCDTSARSAGSGATPRVLVGIAASDGVGIGATNPDTDNWIAQLAAMLGGNTRVVNLGIGSATAFQAETQELPVALDAHPTVAVVWLGVNDYAQGVPLDAFAANLGNILGGLHGAGVKVFVANLPDLRLLPAFSNRDAAALATDVSNWNGAIAQRAQASDATLVDLFSAWQAAPDRANLISGDGLHPTTLGYRALATLFRQAIGREGA